MKIHQSLFQYLLCWHKHVEYIIVTDGWGDRMPWCFWSVCGLYKILNGRSAEQETVSVRRWEWQQLSQNFQRALWPKKIGWGNKIFRYILGKLFFANIGLYSFSFKFRVKVFNFIQLTHHFIIKSRRLNLRHNCPKICNFAQKLGAVAWAWVLLNYYRTLKSIIFYFNIFSFCK